MAAVEEVLFLDLTEEEMRQWVEANPGRVNDRDSEGNTPLRIATSGLESLSLTVWLLDEKDADVHATMLNGFTVLHWVIPPDILLALLDRHADPTLLLCYGSTFLIHMVHKGKVDIVARMLQDPRIRATVDARDVRWGETALHYACTFCVASLADSLVLLLLQAGVNPRTVNNVGSTPLAFLR